MFMYCGIIYGRWSDRVNPTTYPCWQAWHCEHAAKRLLCRIAAYGLAISAISLFAPPFHARAEVSGAAAACTMHGNLIDVSTGRAIDRMEFFRGLAAKNSIVLLGESHTDADHHRWQLQTLAALHGYKGQLVIGFESFPRRLQSVLD